MPIVASHLLNDCELAANFFHARDGVYVWQLLPLTSDRSLKPLSNTSAAPLRAYTKLVDK
jgi:hypothetical protein